MHKYKEKFKTNITGRLYTTIPHMKHITTPILEYLSNNNQVTQNNKTHAVHIDVLVQNIQPREDLVCSGFQKEET